MKKYLLIYFFLGLIFSQDYLPSNERYITGDDGVVRMYINIIGHVQKPGTYIVYDGIDLVSAISRSGGYLQGANLKNILIYSEGEKTKKVNLLKILNSSSKFDKININPHDTIVIQEKLLSKVFASSNLPSILLGMLNIILTIDRTSND
tara:strand:- start:688 stop:1134 length:447 start_codon:yes stop_codon:yes gene_type:complete